MSETPTPEAPQPQQSFGSAPGGTETFGSAPAAPAPDAAPAPKKKSGAVVRIVVAVVVLAIVGAVGWYFNRDKAAAAKVGDCLAGTTVNELNADKLKTVDCTAADAKFKVVQRVEGKVYADADKSCTDAQTEFVFWSGKQGEEGTVLCLAAVKK